MSPHHGEDFVVGLARPTIRSALGRHLRNSGEIAQQRQRVRVVRLGARLLVEAWHGFRGCGSSRLAAPPENGQRSIDAAEVRHQHSICVSGDCSRTCRMQSTNAAGAVVAQVIAVDAGDTTYLSALRRWSGEVLRLSASSGFWAAMTDVAERQRRVQMSPMIMKVAVPLPKHSPMFGQPPRTPR